MTCSATRPFSGLRSGNGGLPLDRGRQLSTVRPNTCGGGSLHCARPCKLKPLALLPATARHRCVARAAAGDEDVPDGGEYNITKNRAAGGERRLASLYPFVAASASLMVLWVFGPFPGSWLTGVQEHDTFVSDLYQRLHFDTIIAPASLLLKYGEAGRAPALMHALPGAVWCALAPLQLHPRSRTAFGGGLHRWGGRAMLAAAAALMVGYAVIDANALFADVHDFGGRGGGVADAVDAAAAAAVASHWTEATSSVLQSQSAEVVVGASASYWPGENGTLPSLPPFNVVGIRSIAMWFIATGVAAGITAARGGFRYHRRWALRHVGAGLWVAGQRPLFAALRVAAAGAGALGLCDGTGDTSAVADAFYYSGYATTFVYFAAAEWALREADTKP